MKEHMTALKLSYLKTIDEICRKDPMGLTIPMDVEDKMGLEPEVAPVMMKSLRVMGLLERPYRGCYRLTKKGRKIMKETRARGIAAESRSSGQTLAPAS